MSTKNLRDERYKIYKESKTLQQAALDEDNRKKSYKIKTKQNEVYKKWCFYDNFIKAVEKQK